MTKFDTNAYADMLSGRLSTIQNLQSAASGFTVTLCVGALVAVGTESFSVDPQAWNELAPAWRLRIAVAAIALTWGHLFSMYQAHAVAKCVRAIQVLEESLSVDDAPTRYFAGGSLRLRLHDLTHGFPSVLFFVSPWLLWLANLLPGRVACWAVLGTLLTNSV